MPLTGDCGLPFLYSESLFQPGRFKITLRSEVVTGFVGTRGFLVILSLPYIISDGSFSYELYDTIFKYVMSNYVPSLDII